jgi:hypothetical protein
VQCKEWDEALDLLDDAQPPVAKLFSGASPSVGGLSRGALSSSYEDSRSVVA